MTTPQSFYKKGTQAELDKNYDDALQYYIKSAQGFLHLSRSTNTDWKKEAGKALERAEKIKAIKGGTVQIDYWSQGLSFLFTFSNIHIPYIMAQRINLMSCINLP